VKDDQHDLHGHHDQDGQALSRSVDDEQILKAFIHMPSQNLTNLTSNTTTLVVYLYFRHTLTQLSHEATIFEVGTAVSGSSVGFSGRFGV
jgi:hypothetical protein